MEINELRDILNGYFGWNKARLTCFACMLVSLFKVRTVNLSELACGFESDATIESRYKRIKRFFREFTISFTVVSGWVMAFFDFKHAPLHLSIDRTNWQWGKQDINILMLSIAYKGIAIPLMWDLLPKRGNSNTAERIALLERFIAQFGKEKIACLLADREFVGNEWFAWLRNEGIVSLKIVILGSKRVALCKHKGLGRERPKRDWLNQPRRSWYSSPALETFE